MQTGSAEPPQRPAPHLGKAWAHLPLFLRLPLSNASSLALSNNGAAYGWVRISSFNLEDALERDNQLRMEVEDAGDNFADGEEVFEDGVDAGSTVRPTSSSPLPLATPEVASRHQKKLQKLCERFRTKRATEAVDRLTQVGLKPRAIENLQAAQPLSLHAFDMQSLPISASGWTAKGRQTLPAGLQKLSKDLDRLVGSGKFKLLDWDG
ncbi:hypothetical protein FB446DRAFT_790017, partial [Lentinula raphanica]